MREKRGGRWRCRGGWTCRHLVCGKRGGGKRCGVHANRVPLFSATGVQDSLTKAQQMDQAGPSSPQKKRAVMKTTFFRTKPLCSHGHAWLHVRRRPSMSLYCTQSHTLARAQSVYCFALLIQFCPSVCTHLFSVSPYCVSEDICIPSALLTHFVAEFRETQSPRQVIHIGSQMSTLAVKGFSYFIFARISCVFRISSSTAQLLYSRPLCFV